MPRQANTRPTSIYWIIDMRPETLVKWPDGLPFYCGKTVTSLSKRLSQHRHTACNRPHGRVAPRLILCGESVRIELVESIPHDQDWIAREQYWIEVGRAKFPNFTNEAKGGAGAAGVVHTPETRAKFSAAKKGKPGRIPSTEERVNRSVAQKGRIISPEHREKLRLANLGKTQSLETIEKRSAKHTGMKRPSETGQRISAALKGRVMSPEWRAKMSAAAKRRWQRKAGVAI